MFWLYVVLPCQVNRPIVLLMELFVTELTLVLVQGLVHLMVQL
jgi:hypothetical protein